VRLAVRFLSAALACLAAATGAVVSVGDTASGAGAPASRVGAFVHVASTDLDTASARQAVVDRYDIVVIRGRVTPELVADIHRRDPRVVVLAYETAAALSATELRLTSEHPDWVARDAAGAAIHPRNAPEVTLADLTNAQFRAWQASRIAAEIATGADGAFIDTLGAYYPAEFYTARPVVATRPVTDAAWRDASADLVARVKAVTARPVVANGFGLGTGAAYFSRSADADVLIAAADGVQIEGFTRWGDAPIDQIRSLKQWNQDIRFLHRLGVQGKWVLAYTKVKRAGAPEQLAALRDFALGSALAGFVGRMTYFGFDDSRGIPVTPPIAPWADVGRPRGGRTADGDAWVRNFDAGVLRVVNGAPPQVTARP